MNVKSIVISLVFVLLHWVVLCLRLDPAHLLTDEPLYQLNYGKYFYTIETASKLLANYGTPWGFDPRFAAGHILMPGVYQGLHLLVLVKHVFPSMPAAVSIKLFIFLALFLFPVVLWWAIRAFGLPQKVVPWGLGLTLVTTYYSTIYLNISAGFITIYSSVLVLMASLALLWNINRSRQKPVASVLVMGSSGLLIYFISPPMNIIALMGYAAFWLAQGKDFWKPRSLLALVLGLVVVVLIAYPWLSLSLPFLSRNADIIAQMTKSPLFPWSASALLLCIAVPFSAPIVIVSTIAAIKGIRSYPAEVAKQKRFLLTFCGTLAAIVLSMSILITIALLSPEHAEILVYVEGILYPSRYIDSLILFMIIPASLSVQLWHESATRARLERKKGARKPTAILYSIFLLVLLGAIYLFPGQIRSFQVSIPVPFTKMVEWMNNETEPNSRIMFEGNIHPLKQEWGFDPNALLPLFVDREFANLLTNESFDILFGPFFSNGKLLGRKTSEFTADELKKVLRLYNVVWIVCYSEESRSAFDRMPKLLTPGPTFEPYRTYRANVTPSFFLKGSGRVHAESNRIVLSDVEPEDSEVVLSYHWFPGMRTDSSVPVEFQESDIDPIGFIRLVNPPRDVAVVYEPRLPVRILTDRTRDAWRRKLQALSQAPTVGE